MPQPTKPGVDWQDIERRYRQGETPSAISRACDVTRQAIDKRVKREGWTRVADTPSGRLQLALAATPRQTPPLARHHGRSDAAAIDVVKLLEAGATLSQAAAGIGMTPSAFKHWRDADADLDTAVREACAAFGRSQVGNVVAAADRGDARAAQWLLEKHPGTREEFGGGSGSGGPTLVVHINVPRNMADMATIMEGETL